MVSQPAGSVVNERRSSVLASFFRIWAVVVACAFVLAPLTLPQPSHAAATDPVITSPTPGAVMPNRWDGTVTFNLGAAPSDDYWYVFECEPDNYVMGDDVREVELFSYESGTDDPSWSSGPFSPIIGPATCEATVRGDETGAFASATWTVLGPSVTFNSVGISPAQFFPLVRDGYADTSTLEWTMTADAVVSVLVADASGAPVKAVSLGRLLWYDGDYGYQAHRWVWDGLRQDGSVVLPGDYTLTVTATGDDGIARSASKTVTAATGVRESGWKTMRRAGAQASKIRRTPGCLAIYPERGSSVTLDCTRGRGITAIWRFTMPADAVSISYKVRGRYRGPTQPVVGSSQPRSTRFDVKLKVRARQVTRIDGVVVRYKQRTPI